MTIRNEIFLAPELAFVVICYALAGKSQHAISRVANQATGNSEEKRLPRLNRASGWYYCSTRFTPFGLGIHYVQVNGQKENEMNATNVLVESGNSYLGIVRWVSVVGYEGLYEVSDHGMVRSVNRTQPHGSWGVNRNLKGRNIRPWMSRSRGQPAYRTVSLCKNGIVQHIKIATIVCNAFIPNPENKPFINHKDGNKLNDCLYNLEHCTCGENNAHAYRSGLKKPVINRGENAGGAKLRADDILKIRGLREKGVTYKKIGEYLNVDKSTAWKVMKGISWTHII